MSELIVTERERLLVTAAGIGAGSITVMEVSAQMNGIDGHCLTAAVSSIVGIVCIVGTYLYGKMLFFKNTQ